MKPFDILLKESVEAHGHLCPGQVVGVRMAMLGCRLIGLDEPTHRDQIKKLIVFVEMDRCTADAVAHVTGVRLGRRSLKFMDYGIMAATFVNLESAASYRVLSTEESRDLADVYAPEIEGKGQRQIQAYMRMPECVLFRVQRVKVNLSEFDLPGPTRKKAVCHRCGQVVRDNREALLDGRPACRPCTDQSYFSHATEVSWEGMNQVPEPKARTEEEDKLC